MPDLDFDFRLDGRRVLVTGGAGHLGAAIAFGIAAAGGHPILAGRTESTLRTACEDLEKQFGKGAASLLVMDLESEESMQQACDDLTSSGGGLQGLVNNAYAGRGGTIEDVGREDLELALSLNVIAPFRLTQLLAPPLRASAADLRGGTAIVNIASMYGVVSPDPRVYPDSRSINPPHYGASKAGLIQLTRYLACHLGPYGVRVNTVSPGPFPSNQVQKDQTELVGRLAERVPLGRIGQAPEVSGAVVFLLSPAASFVTGINLPVDGGWTSW